MSRRPCRGRLGTIKTPSSQWRCLPGRWSKFGQLSRHYFAEISLNVTWNHNQPTNNQATYLLDFKTKAIMFIASVHLGGADRIWGRFGWGSGRRGWGREDGKETEEEEGREEGKGNKNGEKGREGEGKVFAPLQEGRRETREREGKLRGGRERGLPPPPPPLSTSLILVTIKFTGFGKKKTYLRCFQNQYSAFNTYPCPLRRMWLLRILIA